MIIYLYGPDSYRRRQKLNEIVEQYKKKHSGLTVGLTLDDSGQSLFGGHRLVILSEEPTKEWLGKCRALAESKNITVIFNTEKKPPGKFLSQEFNNLTPRQFRNFVIKEAEQRKLRLNEPMLKALVADYCPDSWGVVTEMEKIALMEKPNYKPTKSYKIFDISNIERLLIDEDPAKIFNMLAYQARDKKKFADYDLAIKSGKLDYEAALTDLLIS